MATNRYIFHYTNGDGLLGIVNRHSKEQSEGSIRLWLTDYRYLNDASEGTELQRVYDQVVASMYEKNLIRDEAYEILSAIEFIDGSLFYGLKHLSEDDKKKAIFAESDSYICCFSQESDLLDMWRYYSKGNTGYCLGFSYSFLMMQRGLPIQGKLKTSKVGEFTIEDVIYDNDQKTAIIEEVIKSALSACEQLVGPQLYMMLSGIVVNRLRKYKLLFKHSCFKNENETRMILSVPHDITSFDEKLILEVRYRSSRGVVVPYIEMVFDQRCLINVMVSPFIDRDNNGEKNARESIERYIKDDYPNVTVYTSNLPVRF